MNFAKRVFCLYRTRLNKHSCFSTQKSISKTCKDYHLIHKAFLEDKPKLEMYLSEQKIIELIENHYCLNDIVLMSHSLMSKLQKEKLELTDHQTVFLIFSYNLFPERFQGDQLVLLVLKNMNNKIEQAYQPFYSESLQKHYLQQIFFLKHHLQTFPELQQNVKCTFYLLLCKTYKIDYTETINGYSFDKLWQILAYLPKQKENKFLCDLEAFFLKVISFQAKQAPSQYSLDKFRQMRQFTIRLSDCRGKKLPVFSHLPTSFDTEQQFSTFLSSLQEFINAALLKNISTSQLTVFHQTLSRKNKQYQSAKTQRCFESYCQNHIFLHAYNPLDFLSYFSPQGEDYIEVEERLFKERV